MSGRVEIYHPTFDWGSVCFITMRNKNHLFGITEANVVCRQLGFSGATAVKETVGNGPALLSEVQCSGDEPFIWDCHHNGWNNPSAVCLRHVFDVNVVCD